MKMLHMVPSGRCRPSQIIIMKPYQTLRGRSGEICHGEETRFRKKVARMISGKTVKYKLF